MRSSSTVGDLKEQFCDKTKEDDNKTRFLLNGERLDDESILHLLNLEKGDKIEVFLECRGGGPPKIKYLLNSKEDQILDALNESSECSESDAEKSNETFEHEDILQHLTDDKEIDHPQKTKQDEEESREAPTKMQEMDKVTPPILQEQLELDEKEMNDHEWLKTLKMEFKKGNFAGKTSLHKQLHFYMKRPEINKCEQNIVKSLIERIQYHSELEIRENVDPPQKEKQVRKRKMVVSGEDNVRCLRRRGNKTDENKEMNKRNENEEIEEKENSEEIPKPQNDSISKTNTPQQRKSLFQVFGIISPFIRQKVPTEEEARRFSLAVHLWAEKVQGSVKFLQQKTLTERNFKDILIFAGPNSKWKLIPERTFLQLKNIWQNAVKGEHYFHGDRDTGFEAQNKLHEPSMIFCPFGHCHLSPALNQITSHKTRESFQVEITTKSSRRKLFTPDQKSEVEKPSPTKQEIKEQNKLLHEEIRTLKSSKNLLKDRNENEFKLPIYLSQPKIVRCIQEGCEKTFVTVFGLEQHLKKSHAEVEDFKKSKQECPFCGKETVYVDQHIKAAHKDMARTETCEVCKQKVKHDMKKHRSVCIFCPFCTYQNRKKDRLLKHIEKNHRENSLQSQPLDLTSPRREKIFKNNNDHQQKTNSDVGETTQPQILNCTSTSKEDVGINSSEEEPFDLSQEEINLEEDYKNKSKHCETEIRNPEEALNMKRLRYPFDNENEAYESELEDGDGNDFTSDRRYVKDKLEKELRAIDQMSAKEVDGDEEVLKQFETFMKNKTKRGNESEDFLSDVSTVGMYTRALKNDLLPAFHQLFEPFDSRWILDCTTPKECTFDGKQRFFVKPQEPIYITSKIVQEALEVSKGKGGQQGGQRGTILNATIQFMNFIEIYFNQRLNIYGREPFENVTLYHKGVRTFISGTGAWKMCNDEKDKAQNENRVRQSYQNPNKEAEVLQRYKKYIKSDVRLKNMNKILIHSDNEEKKSTDKEITELGKIAMGEIVAATGCRPVVLLKLTVGAWVDKQPGFNPYNTTEDDRTVDEENGEDKIYRRVNPNLPPKDRACKHQLELNVAECPEMCPQRCEPDGYNLMITWDKTSGTNGPSYLHIPKELKHMIDIYDIKRIRYFKGRKSPLTQNEDWIHEDSSPFFLNSACSRFKSLDLKHIAEAMGIDVTAYSFRKIESTWAICHASEEIRSAEEEALQHSLKVAKDKYQQNKQIKPQKLTQRYIEEENLFPLSFREDIEQTKSKVISAIKSTEEKRTKKRIETLVKRNEAYKMLKSENRPLGPNHRILAAQRKEFLRQLQEVTNTDLENYLKLKPLQWRQLCVRTVCTANGELGEGMRKLWLQMYQGDLRWGVRDARLRAKEKNWPMIQLTRRRDRNSWIAASIRQSHMSEKKTKEKKSRKTDQ